MQNTSSLLKNLYPSILKVMPNKTNAYKQVVGRYISKHSKELYDIAPCDQISFGMEEWDDFYNNMGRDLERTANYAISLTYYSEIPNFNPRAAKDEFTVIQMMIIRYFLIKKMTKETELACIYLAFSGKMYPSVFSGCFPNVSPSEYRHVMEYVVNHELSNKYELIVQGSVFGAIKSICATWLETYEDQFKQAEDFDIQYMIQQLRDRIKSFMQNIAESYYKVYKDKDLYLSYDSDSASEDSFRMADSDSLKSERWAEITMTYITTHSTVDYKICKMASDSNVKADEIKFIIESIQADNANVPTIKELVRLLITNYMYASKEKDVRTIEFISFTISAKPNTKDKNILRQKEIIESWLDENSTQYRKRKSREATKNSYYKSILTYYALIINKACK